MKTAVSIPDATFGDLDRYARTMGLNRSQFVTQALERYIAELRAADLTARMDAALDAESAPGEPADGRDADTAALHAANLQRLAGGELHGDW